jgi:hypothetical protein
MMPVRKALVTALAVAAALAVGAPAASATTAATPLPTAWAPTAFGGFPDMPIGTPSGAGIGTAGLCGSATGNEGQGRTGGNDTQVCMGSGLSFIGPSVGQIATVIGPTIISPAVVGTSVVSAGNATVGP